MSKTYWMWNDEDECWVCEACGMAALNNYRGISVDSYYRAYVPTGTVQEDFYVDLK